MLLQQLKRSVDVPMERDPCGSGNHFETHIGLIGADFGLEYLVPPVRDASQSD